MSISKADLILRRIVAGCGLTLVAIILICLAYLAE